MKKGSLLIKNADYVVTCDSQDRVFEKADVLIAQHEASMSHLCLMRAKKLFPNIKTSTFSMTKFNICFNACTDEIIVFI